MDTAAPLSTYRIQLAPSFDFYRASRICGYLKALGISHLYLSPCLAADRGSRHGYDVVDPSRVNPELGGQEGFDALCRTLRESGLGLVLDIVPNHMAIGARANRWWWDVLANGRSSRYAGHFDIRWDCPGAGLRNKVLVPILRDEFECCLEARMIQLRLQGEDIHIGYFDHELPVSDESLMELQRTAGLSSGSPWPTRSRRNGPYGVTEAAGVGQAVEGNAAATEALNAAIKRINLEPKYLKRFLDLQHYRLVFWRHGHRELNYRRFFDIHHLAGIRVEEEQVFAAVHAMVLRWVHEGRASGLRIDHPDGLRDPTAYLHRLRKAAPGAWIVVEKILAPGETLNPQWPVDGTTGYDFLNVLSGLFVDPNGKQPLTDIYHEFTGLMADYEEVVRGKKMHVLKHLFISELSHLTDLLQDIHRRWGGRLEWRRQDHEQALAEVIAGFPVYRTYIRPDKGVEDPDRAVVQTAMTVAATRRPDLDAAVFRTVEDVLLLRRTGELESDFVLRFQQLTGPVMAKGVEDTAFYCFNRLLALNEVGGDPGSFGTSPDAFHAFCARVQSQRPLTLLSSATHDTKRGEDTRLRIGLLSEVPGRWAEAVRRWSRMNAVFRRNGFPDAGSEYFLYQTLVGTWPIGIDRLGPYMLKAVREAKVHTSWTDPDPVFEEALQRFIEGALSHAEFTADLSHFLKPMVMPAMITSLAQTLIKCTAPGIPDVYQGAELWDLSLVDPDNRRPVDFDHRLHLIGRLASLSVKEILEQGTDGMAKLYVVQRALNARHSRPEAFGPEGAYQPLQATGPKALHAVAYLRGGQCLTVAPRLVVGLGADWSDTWLELPAGVWTNAFTCERWAGGRQAIGALLARFPVGLWLRENQR
jgi:(1->4)-alpha-D-glucan 1-alpha-D-glucosylmutase